MDVVHPHCCGIDLHKKDIKATVMVSEPGGRLTKETRTFGTVTDELLKLSDWLSANAVTHVAMESTGVYWKPIWNLLEGNFELLLANAAHIKAVPGRKTDVKDSEWICDLLRHGLLRGSYVPDKPQRELRELTRYRTSVVQMRTAEINRVQKILEGANIKLASVASDVVGVSGRMILASLIGGEADSTALAELAQGKMRAKIPELVRALNGNVGPHQRFMLTELLEHLDFLDATIDRLSREVTERLGPFEELVELLDTIPGVGRRIAEIIIVELGPEPAVHFPSAGHASAWSGLAPGNNESGGKRKNARTRKGCPALRSAMMEAAQAAVRSRNNYLVAQYHRLARRIGKKQAIVAVAHTILIIAYQMLTRREPYHDLGADYFDQHDRQATVNGIVKRLERLGLKATIEPIPSTS
jgi:transposase